MDKEKRSVIKVTVDSSTKKKLKIKCAQAGVTLQSALEELITDFLNQHATR